MRRYYQTSRITDMPLQAFFKKTILAVAAFAVTGIPSGSAHSVARKWNEQLLAAIRLEVPDPPLHARNLFHTAVVMYDAWAAYDATAIGYLHDEKIQPLPTDIAAARDEAVSYAAYRLLRARLIAENGASNTLPRLDTLLTSLGYSPVLAQAPATMASNPAELGKRIADTILAWSASDRFSLTNFPQPYNESVNPNMLHPMNQRHLYIFSMKPIPVLVNPKSSVFRSLDRRRFWHDG